MMFKHTISFECRRGDNVTRGTVRCDIIDDGFGEPVGEFSVDSNVREITVFIRRKDWLRETTAKLRVGDIVRTENDETFAVFAASEFDRTTISVRARQK